jgi:hypothetical protein
VKMSVNGTGPVAADKEVQEAPLCRELNHEPTKHGINRCWRGAETGVPSWD